MIHSGAPHETTISRKRAAGLPHHHSPRHRPHTALTGTAHAQQFFRIGTGGTAGTYYPIGGMIANAVSVPGKIVATAQASNGSLANVNAVAGGSMESGFSQSDVATWAQKGTGIFEGKPHIPDLRLIANLYPETVHVVV